MEKVMFQNEELQRRYENRYEELRKIVESPALNTEILWDKTVSSRTNF